MSTQTFPSEKTPEKQRINPAFSKKVFSHAGFSLIEIMVVLGIIGTIIAIGMNRLKKPKENANTVVRELSLLGKEIRNHARLFNQTMRLAIEFKSDTGSYWIESSSMKGTVFVDPEKLEKQRKGEVVDPDKDGKPKSDFQKYTKLLKKTRDLPKGLTFRQLETESIKEPLMEGIGYIYFFPDGHLEATALQITDKKDLTWTILFHPLTGEADIVKKELSLRDYKK